ncbi:MAG TPA: nucleotide exchange factor GrpE [Candidatus Dormibacteraeota bacterium]|nr:nucleotide exchange factor GrpE [Candidatus Dormibacteraeota bacterium]
MGKKQDMPPQHRSPDQPEPGGQNSHPGVVDSRASSAVDAEQAVPQSVDPELQAARDEAQANFARYQRLAADFENYKRRTRVELADRTQYANEELLRKLLPILDNLRRALDHAPEGSDRNWFDGLRMVVRQFEDTLQAQGVSPIPAVGEKFDPSKHEAIAREETDEHEEGTIVEEMQPGYRLHERVLRPTLVKVAHPRALKS